MKKESNKEEKNEKTEQIQNIVENKEHNKKEYLVEKQENKNKVIVNNTKRKNIKIISITTLFLIIIIFSIIFALINIDNEKILKGISILGIDVGELTIQEATDRINDAIEERFNDENNSLILKKDEDETRITANMFNAKIDINSAVAQAYNVGREGNIITNNYAILFTKIFKKNIKPNLYLDEELLANKIADINSKMKDALVESSYYIEDKTLTIVKGKAGYIINKEELKKEIYEQLSNIYDNYQIIDIPVIYKEPEGINLEKIHSEIYKEPQNAYVEKNPTIVHTHVDGVDFAISIEEAQKLIEEEKEEYNIPLKITKPKKTISDLGEEAFPDKLATFTTLYDASYTNRANNIELATQKVNGTVVMPGEKFSFNTVVGRRTIEAGFKEGTAYIGGKVVPDVGGGVCQLSSTIYNAALLANLEIIERSNHIFLTGYVAESRDATVYYGSVDFIFKNTRKYPIKIVTTSSNGICKVTLLGIKEENEYDVVIQSKVTSYISYSTTYKEDPTLEEGKEIVEQSGVNGCISEAYRILKSKGKVISQKLLSKDTYSAKERIVRKGTKKVSKPTNTENTTKENKEIENASIENKQENE